jgi:hypothetical protein
VIGEDFGELVLVFQLQERFERPGRQGGEGGVGRRENRLLAFGAKRGFKARSLNRGDERRELAGADRGVDDVGGGLLYDLFSQWSARAASAAKIERRIWFLLMSDDKRATAPERGARIAVSRKVHQARPEKIRTRTPRLPARRPSPARPRKRTGNATDGGRPCGGSQPVNLSLTQSCGEKSLAPHNPFAYLLPSQRS